MRIIAGIGSTLCLVSALFSVNTTKVRAQDASRSNITIENKSQQKTSDNASPVAKLFPYRPIDAWVGQRFVFLPGPKASENSTYDDFSGKVVRKQYQGRIAKVVSAEDFGGKVHVIFELEDTKERLRAYAPPQRGTVRGMALIDDLDNARAQWMGKTLRFRQIMIFTYDEEKDVVGPLMVKQQSPMKVVEIVPGWDEEKPARFWVETAEGKRGFVDVNLSGTNVFEGGRGQHRFEHYFKIEEPQKARR